MIKSRSIQLYFFLGVVLCVFVAYSNMSGWMWFGSQPGAFAAKGAHPPNRTGSRGVYHK